MAIGVFAGLWLHSARLESQGQSIAERPPQTLTQREIQNALRDFESARASNPGSRPVEREAGLLIRVGRSHEAIAMLKPVVRREPDNLTAWVLLAAGARTIDPGLAREAVARARALNPLGARGP